MAIFTKFNRKTISITHTSIVAAHTRMKGEINSKCRIHVDGKFSGPIYSDSIITIGKAGFIEGDIYAKELVVTGHFSGTAICEKVRILAGGKIVGRITSNMLEIERGCFFHGRNIFKETAKEIEDLTQGKSPAYRAKNMPDNATAISTDLEKAM